MTQAWPGYAYCKTKGIWLGEGKQQFKSANVYSVAHNSTSCKCTIDTERRKHIPTLLYIVVLGNLKKHDQMQIGKTPRLVSLQR